MSSISLSTAKSSIEKFINLNLPIFLHGPIGLGKSSLIRQIGLEQNRNVIIIMLSQIEYSDLRGIPYISNNEVNWSSPSFLPKNKDDTSIIFFDELNCAQASILSAAYQLILDRKIGDYELPKGCSIIAAGNNLEDNDDLTIMPKPLLNRFVHISVDYSYKCWLKYAQDKFHHLILAYLENNKSDLSFKKTDNIEFAFNTPRSWEYVSKVLNSYPNDESIIKDIQHLKILIRSCIGQAISGNFITFIIKHLNKTHNSLDYKEILNNPDYTNSIKFDVALLQHFKDGIYQQLEIAFSSNLKDIKTLTITESQTIYSALDNAIGFLIKYSDIESTLSFIYYLTKQKNIILNNRYMPKYFNFCKLPEVIETLQNF